MHGLGTSQWFKKQSHYFADEGPSSRSYSFSSSHIQMWELGHKEGWVLENWCFRIVVSEKTLESHLDCKEIKPVNPIGNQPWIFTGRTDAEAKAPILWPLMQRTDSLEKTLMLGKIEGRGKWTEHEMAGWHHRLTGHEFAQTPGDSEGQGSLVCCSPWSRKEWDTTEQLNNNSATTSLQDTFIPLKVSTWRFVSRGLTVPPFYGFGSYLI